MAEVTKTDGLYLRVRDWSRTPGPRQPEEGPWSGEEYRDTVLIPVIERARKLDPGGSLQVTVDLSGTYGYSTGWLEEVFGGLIRRLGIEAENLVQAVDPENPDNYIEAMEYMADAVAYKIQEESWDNT